jgi:hypothetical protein
MGEALHLNRAVEALVVALHRATGCCAPPAAIERAVRLDPYPPSLFACAAMVEAAARGEEPAFFTERWPRTFGTLQQLCRR